MASFGMKREDKKAQKGTIHQLLHDQKIRRHRRNLFQVMRGGGGGGTRNFIQWYFTEFEQNPSHGNPTKIDFH